MFYFNETGHECDFVVLKNNKAEEIIQVCYSLEFGNRQREEAGLLAAMNFFDMDYGIIITMNQSDEIQVHTKRISVIPAFQFVSK